MKTSLLSVFALCCVVAMAAANYYGSYSYVPYNYGSGSGYSSNTLLWFVGLLFLLTLLFNTFNRNNTNIINLTAPSTG